MPFTVTRGTARKRLRVPSRNMTCERYDEIIRKNILPLLGAAPLLKLRKDQINAAYAEVLAGGRRGGQGGLSPAIVNTALPRIRFHDLRHAYATHLLMSGVH